jgi:hypothetical protein
VAATALTIAGLVVSLWRLGLFKGTP